MELKVGDKVRLTGTAWAGYGGTLKVGDIVTVTRVAENGKAWAGVAQDVLTSSGDIMPSYEIELVTDERTPDEVGNDIAFGGDKPIHTLASVTEGIRELIGVLVAAGFDPEEAKSIIMSNIEARL